MGKKGRPRSASPCPADEGAEAATQAKISKRKEEYADGFLVMEHDGQIIGFINSGCAHNVVMSDETFKELVGHDAEAPNVVIMSVVVEPAFPGRGYATELMRTFEGRMKARGKKTIHLMCKERHIDMYAHFGYEYVRPSNSDHRGVMWHEMVKSL